MSCDTETADVWPEKHPDATLDYAVNFEQECARKWERWKDFTQGARIRVFIPGQASGLEMEATIAGRTGGRMPQFPTAIGQIAYDGSVVWTGRAISADSLVRTITGVPTWAVDDAAVTIANENVSGLLALADLSGGVDQEDYTFTVTAIAGGLEIVKTVILPVRIPVRRCG